MTSKTYKIPPFFEKLGAHLPQDSDISLTAYDKSQGLGFIPISVQRSMGYTQWTLAPYDKERVKYMRENYITQPNDVFIVSYPKSGQTWMLNI